MKAQNCTALVEWAREPIPVTQMLKGRVTDTIDHIRTSPRRRFAHVLSQLT